MTQKTVNNMPSRLGHCTKDAISLPAKSPTLNNKKQLTGTKYLLLHSVCSLLVDFILADSAGNIDKVMKKTNATEKPCFAI